MHKRRDSINTISSSDIETNNNENNDLNSEADSINNGLQYQIDSVHNESVRKLNNFLKDPKFINAKGDPTTNFIDRLLHKCYNIPNNKLLKFFQLIEDCRKDKKHIMIAEKQGEYSGIMLDFDIYQDDEKDQLNDILFQQLCQKIISVLSTIININNINIPICITRKPSIKYNEEKECYKDGFHVLIPSVKVSKGVKKFLIKKLIDEEIIDQVFSDVIPAKNIISSKEYSRNDFLDVMCSSVPVFLIGSNTKPNSTPYQPRKIYNVNIKNQDIIVVEYKGFRNKVREGSANLVLEFSLNYSDPNGIIKKENYNCINKYKDEITLLEKNIYNKNEEELINLYGSLSTNAVHDAKRGEIKNLLDALAPFRSDDYNEWFNILFILANISQSYKDLAEYFSRKSKKFNAATFEKLWIQLCGKCSKHNNMIYRLHIMARKDNPQRYELIRKQSVVSVLLEKAYHYTKEGNLNHSDIAEILFILLQHKYINDIPLGEKQNRWYEFILDDDEYEEGELFKWYCYTKEDKIPVSLSKYISKILPNLFEEISRKIKENFDKATEDTSKYYKRVYMNFNKTTNKLGEHGFKNNILKEAEILFAKKGFANSLDKDPMLRGVANGILKLNTNSGPQLIQGYHSYRVSKYTNVPYIPFNPYDPMTKKILYVLRNLFPDNESDSFEFLMNFLASTIDGNPKESMFLLMVGKGANGKSFLVELHKSAVGDAYSVKLPIDVLTSFSNNKGSATPEFMMLKDASLAYYSESNRNERLNIARIKELTGMETIAARGLFKDTINFKPKCHHLATTNWDFEVESNDHGTWRRLIYLPLKITFMTQNDPKYRADDPFIRLADPSITKEWGNDPEIKGRYLGILVWYHYFLYVKYNGSINNVPHPHILFETDKYRRRQDNISQFLASRLAKTSDPESKYLLSHECIKFNKWYLSKYPGSTPPKNIYDMLLNSEIAKHIKVISRDGPMLIGYRFLDEKEDLLEGETFAIKDVYEMETDGSNFGINIETPDQFYDRICADYNKYKSLFDNKTTFDIDFNIIKDDNKIQIQKHEEKNPYERIEKGIKLRKLEDTNMNLLTDKYISAVNIEDINSMMQFISGGNKSVNGGNKSVNGGNKSVNGENKSVNGENKSVKSDKSQKVTKPIKINKQKIIKKKISKNISDDENSESENSDDEN